MNIPKILFTVTISVFFIGAGLLLSDDLAAKIDDDQKRSLITLEIVNTPFGQALKEVSSQTGYKIVIEKDFKSIPVSGIYKSVTIEEFVRRALRGKNISVISDDNKKLIVVRLFGKKKGFENLVVISDIEDGPGSTLTSEQISDIKLLHKEQQADHERWKSDPDSIDPYTEERLGDISSLHEKQVSEHEAWKQDPASVDPDGKAKLQDIRKLHEQQVKEKEAWKKNPDSIDPYSGAKLGDLNALHQKQAKEYQEWKNNPESIDPYTGKTLGELKRLHEQQEKEIAAKRGR